MDRLRSGFHRKARRDTPSRPTIVTDPDTITNPSAIRSRNTTPEPATQPVLQVPGVPVKKTASPVFRTLRDLSRSHKRARSPAAANSDTSSPVSALSARDSPIDRFANPGPHPLSAVSPHDDGPPQQRAQPKIPSFLTLSPHEIDTKFQEIVWLERNRMVAAVANPSPDFRWARVTGDRRKLDRYMNIQPWENHRVRLHVPVGKQDYINASPIALKSVSPAARAEQSKDKNGGDRAGPGLDRYIAMQGPKHKTTDHVWRMIVEQLDSPGVIVMLTETHEGDMEKCYPYFPRSPGDAPLEIGIKDEFGDGFRASVRCEAIEETEAGEAIELRKLVVRVHKGPRNDAANGTVSEHATPVAEFPIDENGDVKMLSPTKAAPDDDDVTFSVDADDDAGSVIVEVGRTSDDEQQQQQQQGPDTKALPRDEARRSSEPEVDERIIWHFLYKKWPDFGVPALEDVDSFFTLMRLSREKNTNPTSPRIVHCSAGVGRSGTFIALEHLMREMDAGVLENWDAAADHLPGARTSTSTSSDGDAASTEAHNGHVENGEADADADAHGDAADGLRMDVEEAARATADDEATTLSAGDLVFNTVNQLREQRRHMVQAESQFQFIYQVLRKLWEDKYGRSSTNLTTNTTTSSSKGSHRDATPVSDHPPRLSLSTDGEPAAKRLEFDPFVEE